MTVQRFPSAGNISKQGLIDGNNSDFSHSRRTTSWSGSLNDSFSPPKMGENKYPGEAYSMPPSTFMPDPSLMRPLRSSSFGEELQEGIPLLLEEFDVESQTKKAYKSGSFDLKIKVDYSNSKDLKSHLANGYPVKSLLSVSVRGRLAVGEGDKVAIYDVGQLIGQITISPVTADKTSVKHLSENVVRFEILQLVLNPAVLLRMQKIRLIS
ncbi:hypothetical protein RYX36_034815 [Vicia faba]